MRMVPRMPPIYMWFSCNASEPHWSTRRSSGRHVTAHSAEASLRNGTRNNHRQGVSPYPATRSRLTDGRERRLRGNLALMMAVAASCQRPVHIGADSALAPSFCRRCESRRAFLVRRGGRKSTRLSAVPRFCLIDFVSRALLSVYGSRASAGFRAPALPSESARRSQVRAVLLPTLQRLPPAGLGSRWLRAQSAVTGDVGSSKQSRCAAAAAQGAEQ
jgi:hypothetical protein